MNCTMNRNCNCSGNTMSGCGRSCNMSGGNRPKNMSGFGCSNNATQGCGCSNNVVPQEIFVVVKKPAVVAV